MQGWQPHHGIFCDTARRGLPYYILGRGRCQMLHHINSNMAVSWGYQCHKKRNRESLYFCAPNSFPLLVDGSTDIHVPVCVICPIWRASYVDAVAGIHPVPSLCTQHATGGYHNWPPPSRGKDPLTKTKPSHRALRQGVLWWHRTPPSWLWRYE